MLSHLIITNYSQKKKKQVSTEWLGKTFSPATIRTMEA